MADYTDKDNTSEWNKRLDSISLVFTIIFIIEAVCKIIAMGFVLHKTAYLRDGWNILDFIIVLAR